MELGIALPTAGALATPVNIVRVAQEAERLGYASPILFGSVSPAGIRRAARVADGFNPIATSAGALRAMVAGFRAAAAEAGRDPETLTVVARANTVFTREPLGERRPYLGGSPKQIAGDLADGGVDEVLLSSVGRADHDIDIEIRLMTDIRDAATTVSWARSSLVTALA